MTLFVSANPKSNLVLRAGPEAHSEAWRTGEDYEADLDWGTVGRLPQRRLKEGQAVYASYRHAQLRLDTVVLTANGRVERRPGEPCAAAPRPPKIQEGERHLANLWLPGRIRKLGPEHLFPILEAAYPEPPKPAPTVAERLLPRTRARLRAGEPLRILAWGDSVTVGTYLPEPAKEWIVLTPHYVRPDWMGLTREREVDEDPRPYVAGLRIFAARHGVALAGASLRYGRLWRQGLPCSTLMLNSINHPDGRGMKLFADALMELFP